MLVYIIDYASSCIAMNTQLEAIKDVFFIDDKPIFNTQKLRVIKIKKPINGCTCSPKDRMKDYV